MLLAHAKTHDQRISNIHQDKRNRQEYFLRMIMKESFDFTIV